MNDAQADFGGCCLADKLLPSPEDETVSDIVCNLIFT